MGRPDVIAPLRAEAPRVVKQSHANVVPIYDIGAVDDRLFFVSELAEGGSLDALLRALAARREPCPPALAVFIAMEVAAAATYLRRTLARAPETARAPLRLVPRSIQISVEGEVKLLFYGAALDHARSPRAASPLGGLRESGSIALGLIRATSPAADAQAVAVLLGQMLTGRLHQRSDGEHAAAGTDAQAAGRARSAGAGRAGQGSGGATARLRGAARVAEPAAARAGPHRISRSAATGCERPSAARAPATGHSWASSRSGPKSWRHPRRAAAFWAARSSPSPAWMSRAR